MSLLVSFLNELNCSHNIQEQRPGLVEFANVKRKILFLEKVSTLDYLGESKRILKDECTVLINSNTKIM